MNITSFVSIRGDQPITTSIKVAEAFNKQHHHVCQKISKLDCSDAFLTRNFSRVQFEHRGNQYDAYEMTKDGFMFLVMGFTGKQAASIKEAYISAFNAMAEQLHQNHQAKPQPATIAPDHTEDVYLISGFDLTIGDNTVQAWWGSDGQPWVLDYEMDRLMGLKLYRSSHSRKNYYGRPHLFCDGSAFSHECSVFFSPKGWAALALFGERTRQKAEVAAAAAQGWIPPSHILIERAELQEIADHAEFVESQFREIARTQAMTSRVMDQSQMPVFIVKNSVKKLLKH